MFDLLITGGKLVDGTGNPWMYLDVGIQGDRVAAVGRLAGRDAARVIDATGMVVCPGFVDMHGHSELGILADGRAACKLRQGITTEVVGEGPSPAPVQGAEAEELSTRCALYGLEPDWSDFPGYFRRLERSGVAINIACLVGMSTLRNCVMGSTPRVPEPSELHAMRHLLAESMQEGAFGLVSSLATPSAGAYASLDELADLAAVAARDGGNYHSHIRDEGDGRLDAIAEVIEISRRSGAPGHVLHIKVAGRANWGTARRSIELIERARSDGVDVDADQYPYEWASLGFRTVLPRWAVEGGTARLIERLRDPATRERLKQEIPIHSPGRWNGFRAAGGWEGLVVSEVRLEPYRPLQGKSLAEIGREQGRHPADVAFDIVADEQDQCKFLHHWACEEDVRTFLAAPWISVCTDGYAVAPDGPLSGGLPHPRYYGTFPRILGRYVREQKVLALEEAIRKMTGWPAGRLGLSHRGLLREGYFADLVVFDPGKVIDTATYEDPHRYPVGIEYVVVNGRVSVELGQQTAARAGRALRRGSDA